MIRRAAPLPCAALILVLALAVAASPGRAQRVARALATERSGPDAKVVVVTEAVGVRSPRMTAPMNAASAFTSQPAASSAKRERPGSAWSILASAFVPGAGQAMLRQWRAAPYLALEGLAISQYRSDSRSARRDRDAYRLLAANVARAAFGTFLPNGDFQYYERMESYLESGAYDLVAGGDLEPEQDTTTFNGAMWLLARRTYWKSPSEAPERGSAEWQRAERFYAQRAIRPEYRWSWRGAPAELEQFRRFIRSSNDRYRESVADLGLLLGNHLLATVDAYVTVQLRRRSQGGNRLVELSVQVPF